MKTRSDSNILSRNARFLWLAVLFVTPVVAFVAYGLTPHGKIWQEVLYGLLCLPLFVVFVVATVGSVLSFLMRRLVTDL